MCEQYAQVVYELNTTRCKGGQLRDRSHRDRLNTKRSKKVEGTGHSLLQERKSTIVVI